MKEKKYFRKLILETNLSADNVGIFGRNEGIFEVDEYGNFNQSYWYISIPKCSHFNEINIKDDCKKGGILDEENWESCIYFDNKEKAEQFKNKLIEFISSEYKESKLRGWFSAKDNE